MSIASQLEKAVELPVGQSSGASHSGRIKELLLVNQQVQKGCNLITVPDGVH